MAGGAALLKRRLVGVPVAIAAIAETKTFPFFLFVTFGAVHLAMGPLQRVRALIMVKNDLLERGLQAVALIAVRSRLPFMNILVAGDAAGIFE